MRLRFRPTALALALATATTGAAALASLGTAEPASASGATIAPHRAHRAPELTALRKQAEDDRKRPDATNGLAGIADRMAPDNAWKLRVDSATALASDSDAQVANLVQQVHDSVGQRAHINAYSWNTSIFIARPGTPRVRVSHNDCQGTGETGQMYTGRKIFENVPMPEDAMPSPGGDGQMTVYDPESDMLWDFWVTNHSADGTWSACWGGRIDDLSTNRGYFPGTEGASASGTAVAAGAITPADVKRGRIDHALNLNIRQTAGWQNWTWPAQRADGVGSAGTGSLRQGQRLRLDPSIDVTTLGLPPLGVLIARAAQEYGFIVTDSSPQVSLVTASGASDKARTGVDPWDAILAGPEWEVLVNFPWQRMQAMPLAYGK